jgi:biopolymer transport protein ExbB
MLTDLFLKAAYGGAEWVMWVLVAIGFVAATLAFDRLLFFSTRRVNGPYLAHELNERLHQGDLHGAWELVNSYRARAIECIVVAAGLRAFHRGAAACGEAMLSVKARERRRLESHLSMLATIGSNAPFVGLLGTVLGIIKAAHELSGSSAGDPRAVMSGVFEALVATAVGLFIAIPAVVAFNAFQRKVRSTLAQVDSLAHLVLTNAHVVSQRPKASPTAPPTAHSAR